MNKNLKEFKRYIYDKKVDHVIFDNNSADNYYHHLEKLKEDYTKFTQIKQEIKTINEDKKYDSATIISGDIDFSYILYLIKIWELLIKYTNTFTCSDKSMVVFQKRTSILLVFQITKIRRGLLNEI